MRNTVSFRSNGKAYDRTDRFRKAEAETERPLFRLVGYMVHEDL